MSIANPLWGAPRIHGELLKLGIDIGQTSVAKYMARNLLRLLYGLLIMGHGRRQILWVGVTGHPTAEWIANQLTEACRGPELASKSDDSEGFKLPGHALREG